MYQIAIIVIAGILFGSIVFQIIERLIKRIRKNRNKKSDRWINK